MGEISYSCGHRKRSIKPREVAPHDREYPISIIPPIRMKGERGKEREEGGL